MYYTYCIKVTPETQDDVNAKFREQELDCELFVSEDGEFFICPQLSHKMWKFYPQTIEENGLIDKRWNEVIEKTVIYLMSTYGMQKPLGNIKWLPFKASYRCSKMESYLRERDLYS